METKPKSSSVHYFTYVIVVREHGKTMEIIIERNM
jgi:hypothetical protein